MCFSSAALALFPSFILTQAAVVKTIWAVLYCRVFFFFSVYRLSTKLFSTKLHFSISSLMAALGSTLIHAVSPFSTQSLNPWSMFSEDLQKKNIHCAVLSCFLGDLKRCAVCKIKPYNSWFITCVSVTDMLRYCWAREAGKRGWRREGRVKG